MIIHLNGWPGVGKRTIGEVLAAQLKARFIHNHLLHDVAVICCGLDDPHRWELYDKVQKAAYEALLTRPPGEIFVMTNALCRGSARERAAWNHVVDLVMPSRVGCATSNGCKPYKGGPLHDFLKMGLGREVLHSETTISATSADTEVFKILNVKSKSPLLLMRETHYDEQRKPFLFSINLHNTDVAAFTTVRSKRLA